MDPEMIWEQMEMRNAAVVGLLKEMFGADNAESEGEEGEGEGEDGEEEDEEMEDDDEEDDGEFSDEEEGEEEFGEEESDSEEEDGEFAGFEEHEEYFRKLGAPGIGSSGTDHAVEGGDDSEEEEDPMADATKDLTLSTFDLPGSGRPQKRFVPPLSLPPCSYIPR